MRVLHVVPSFFPAHAYGGPIISVYGLCAELARQGCDVRVLTTDANGLGQVLDVEKGRPIELAPNFTVRYCRRRWRHSVSPELLRELPGMARWADVIHLTAVYNFPTFPTLASCRISHKPVVWSPRGALQRWQNSRRRRWKAAWEMACRVLLPGQVALHVTSEQEAAESAPKFPRVRTVVIPNGVAMPDAVDHAPPNGTLRLMFLGRIDKKKGIENLLEACSRLNGAIGRCWELTVAGAGDANYIASLRHLAHERRLGEQVRFVGEMRGEPKARLFASSDIAVFPSHTENFGMVVAEALAHGVPVIATKGTPWGGVEGHGCGLWVDNESGALSAAIERMSQMPMREMGMRGRDWMAKEFTWSSVAQQMIELYRRLQSGEV
ncbi:MAG TPA: glycosyltransferase [Terriglobales bacterium]|nr:glycosyltransferase [Terriglobales bacterium]